MTEPTTTNKGLIVPNTGDLSGTWGSAALNPDFAAIDGMFGGVVSLPSTSGVLSAPAGSITPSAGPTQSQNAILRFSAALTTNITVGLPLPGFYIIENLAAPTANQVIQFYATTPGGGEVVSTPYGSRMHIFSDGTNVRFVPGLGMFPGTMIFMGGTATFPAWINACTVRPFQFCDGATFLISQYPALAAIFGTKFGGDGITTSATPNLSGRVPLQYDFSGSRITAGGCGINGQSIGAAGGEQTHQLTTAELASHIHGINQTAHHHGYQHPTTTVSVTGPGVSIVVGSSPDTTTNEAIDISLQSAGSDTAHNNVQPSIVAGVWLVKT